MHLSMITIYPYQLGGTELSFVDQARIKGCKSDGLKGEHAVVAFDDDH